MKQLLIISIIGLLFCSCKQEVKNAESISIAGEFVFMNGDTKAGDPISLSGNINTSDVLEAELQLVVQNALNTIVYPIRIDEGKFSLNIGGDKNQLIGENIFRLVYQDQILHEAKLFTYPQKAIDKTQNFNGPKSLFANDDDGSMNVTIAHDKFNNPLLPPSTINYQSSYNGKIEDSSMAPIENLVAYKINNSKKKAGKYLIGSSINEGYSQEQELIIGPAMPTKFSIQLVNYHPYADSRQVMHFKTSVLKDQWSNIVADGTLLLFTVMEQGSLVGVFQTFTIGGIANVYIENPSKESNWSISAGFHDQLISNQINVSFSRNVNDFSMSFDKKHKELTIGPVIGILGQLVPDGTEVVISNSEYDLEDYIFLEDGKTNYKMNFEWQQLKPTELEVLIGGITKKIKID